MKVYVSGPIFGIPGRNKEMFDAWSGWLQSRGYMTVNPLEVEPDEHSGACPVGRMVDGDVHTNCCHMRADIRALMDCDIILMIPGWESSQGARTELFIATVCGITPWFWQQIGIGETPT